MPAHKATRSNFTLMLQASCMVYGCFMYGSFLCAGCCLAFHVTMLYHFGGFGRKLMPQLVCLIVQVGNCLPGVLTLFFWYFVSLPSVLTLFLWYIVYHLFICRFNLHACTQLFVCILAVRKGVLQALDQLDHLCQSERVTMLASSWLKSLCRARTCVHGCSCMFS